MLHRIISNKKQEWLESHDCTIKPLVDYIRSKAELRDTQIEAIETYLYLKINGQNKPLWQLFSEGFFNTKEDLSRLHISQTARDILESNTAARALFEFARQKNGGTATLLPELERFILDNAERLDYDRIIKEIFYGVSYADYLFSLPMGAGKTFLMAAFIYLDLYFAENEPDNRTFAHNFIILVPSGLKSSIIPSLKTIEKFDPSWVLQEPAASRIKRMIRFEILDQPKSAKKSNKARNPNAQKIIQHQPLEDMMGLVMVVNAEKVILDRLELTNQMQLIEKSDDEKDRQANELRNLISKIPNLCIHIDEVHHAATDDIKLRQVVNKWNANGTVNSVIGYSGTPYLSSPDSIPVSENVNLRFTQITNTVYYYPLTRGIQTFLKKPRVEVATGLEPLKIIEKGVKDFYDHYKDTVYENGACAKLAIYCGNIPRLEEEVHPFLIGELKIQPDEILKYHKGNKDYKLPKENETDFNSLDTPVSRKRIVLLVQVGKEGWDCRSLTGVILAQKGDSPTNMVLQTSCRCLRQVDKRKEETAVIWLNDFNAKTLNKQLKEEQHTSIEEINRLGKGKKADMVDRFSRLEHLRLPEIDFYQLKVEYKTEFAEETPNTSIKLKEALADRKLYNTAIITSRGLNPSDPQIRNVIEKEGSEPADFKRWVHEITKGSFNSITASDLLEYKAELEKIFDTVTFKEDGQRRFNELYNQSAIQSRIRLAFHCKRDLQTESEVIPKTARMLIVEKLESIAKNDKLYPDETDLKRICDLDSSRKSPHEALEQIKNTLREQGLASMADSISFSQAVFSKDNTFHYLPYNFWQSRFELNFLKEALTLKEFADRKLEIYYNGERHLTEFSIKCYEKHKERWKYVGHYTPDFLIIKRKANKIHKAMIVETKGSVYAEKPDFVKRRRFMESEFLKMNNDKFGYRKFDYLYLTDSDDMNQNLARLNSQIVSFFKEE